MILRDVGRQLAIIPVNQPNIALMTTKTFLLLAGTLAGCSVLAAPVDWSKLPPPAQKLGVTFANDIQPIFKESCVRCHGPKRHKAQLRLDSLPGVLKGTKKGPVVKPGDSADSLLVKAISQLDPDIAMPPKPHHHGHGDFGRPPAAHGPDMHPPGKDEDHDLRDHENDDDHDFGGAPPRGAEGKNRPGMRPPHFGPPPKPLTAEQVGLVRAWIDQGAK